MREPKRVTVNDKEYEVLLMEPFKSFRILTRLTKMAAPVAGKLAEAGLKDANAEIDTSKIVEVLTELSDRLDEGQLEKTLKELLESVMIEGEKGFRRIVPERDFLGDVPSMLLVAAEVIKAEYGGFLKFVPDRQSGGTAGAIST